MKLEKRIRELEGRYPKGRRPEDLTDDELAQVITGDPSAKSSDLTDEELEAILEGVNSESFDVPDCAG